MGRGELQLGVKEEALGGGLGGGGGGVLAYRLMTNFEFK